MQTSQTAHSPSHRYANAGDHQVKISGAFPRIYCYNPNGTPGLDPEYDSDYISPSYCEALRSVDQWGDIEWASMNYAFYGARDLQILASDMPNLTRVTDMSQMFYYATNLTGNFSGWDVSNVTNMREMFFLAENFNQPLNSWNVGNVKDMSHMFG